ncbi:MAG: NAD(P)H-hydrate dehydratase [Sphingobacteriales bacterium]|nr:NAD(P)H-hydrate dehydratase [Sphingobacteriales bacterium]
MIILSAEEIREWDQFTIRHEPIASIDLMERAASKCVEWLEEKGYTDNKFSIFCGKGNNGGDGLAIGRMLSEKNYQVSIYILDPMDIGVGHKGTEDFQINLARLHQVLDGEIHFIQSGEDFHEPGKDEIIIDALFGSGLNRGIDGLTAKLVEHINNSGCEIISIDIPTGLFVDRSSKGNIIIKATHTLSFQCYKPAFLVAENAEYVGEAHLLDIGLHNDFLKQINSRFELLDDSIIHSIYKPRNRFSHKGDFGHALLIAGSYGKMGAAVLSAKACLRSGVGLLTCHIPKCGYEILQTAVPEAMILTDFNSSFITKIEEDISKHTSIGIGPGIGTASETKAMLTDFLHNYKSPVVLDADALNIIATDKKLLKLIPPGSILTPHPKEFERLFGETANDFDRILLATQKSKELNVIIILKGHYTFIAAPDGHGYFNSTGNAGMATAGSGDVLTGILTGLLAQNYSSVETAILAVYLHGLAGDIAAKELSMEALIAGDIINKLGPAFLHNEQV